MKINLITKEGYIIKMKKKIQIKIISKKVKKIQNNINLCFPNLQNTVKKKFYHSLPRKNWEKLKLIDKLIKLFLN